MGRVVVLCCFTVINVLAQPSDLEGSAQQIELGIASGNGSIVLHTSYVHTYALGLKKNMKVGYGVRLSWLRSFDDLSYVTAPGHIRTGETGWQSLWSSSVAARLDTFVTENPAIGSVNLGFYTSYFFNPLFEVGLFAEIVGFGFGIEQDGIYNSPDQQHIPSTVSADPEKFNFLPLSRGAYQAEFFARYWIAPRLGWKAGLNLYRSEYVADQPLNFGNRRFKNLSAMFSVSISYRWGAD